MAGGRGKRCASDDTDDSLALRLVDLLNDDQVVAKLRAALYPTELRDEVRELSKQVAILNSQLAEQNARIKTLEDKVDALEYDHDAAEQYSRRPNLRVQGVREMGDGEDTDAMILDLLNTKMSMDPPIERHHIERSHRLGRKLDHQDGRRDGAHARPRQRVIIVRFATERLRDEVFRARTNLKDHNKEHRDNQIYLNDDLTARRAKLSFDARQLKKGKKIADTWTSYGKVMLKLVNGQVKEVKSSSDLNI